MPTSLPRSRTQQEYGGLPHPERIGSPPPGVADTVSGAQAMTALGAYVLVAVVITAWSHQHRNVT